jgi:hypothetical protein
MNKTFRRLMFLAMLIMAVTGLAACRDKEDDTVDPIDDTPVITDEIHDSPDPADDTRSQSLMDGLELIVDNSNKEFSYTSAILKASETGDGTFQETYVTSGDDTFTATWRPYITVPGYYKVYMTWPEAEDASSMIPIEVDYEGGTNTDTTKHIDQTMNEGLWVLVGTYYMTVGTGNAVHIDASDGQTVYADAVLFDLAFEQAEVQKEEPLEPVEAHYEPTSVTKIVKTHEGVFRLTVDGEPFFVNGVAGIDELELMAEAGANAVRTYSIAALEDGALLDRAHELGIKVMVGLWLDHESASFTYADNPDEVQAQYEAIIQDVERFKKHPAVLAWAVGNEVDSTLSLDMPAIHRAFNQIARYIHESDPYHPTIAILAGSHSSKINGIRELAPHIDMLGINSYSALYNVQNRVVAWNGPYMVTEYALNQPMETQLNTAWGAIIEPDSLDKADMYYQRHEDYIYAERDEGAVGSFVFKDTGSFRVTHTWYGLILNKLRTPAFYAMQATWNQTAREDIPYIIQTTIDGKTSLENVQLETNGLYEVEATPEFLNPGDTVTYHFEVRPDVGLSSNNPPGIVHQSTFEATAEDNVVIMTAPPHPGNYRLFAYMTVNDTSISSFSFPFQVEGEPYILEDQEGVIIVSIFSETGYEEFGTFSSSSNRMYQNVPTRFTREQNSYAQFTPVIMDPGFYEVFYYNLSEGLGQTDDYQIEIHIQYSAGQIEIVTLGVTTSAEGWVSLGVLPFDADGVENIQVVKSLEGTKVARATAIALLPQQ